MFDLLTLIDVPIHDIDEIHKRVPHLVPIHHREQRRRRRLNGLKSRAARPEQRGTEDEETDVDGHGAHQDGEGVAEPFEDEGLVFSVKVKVGRGMFSVEVEVAFSVKVEWCSVWRWDVQCG